MPREATNAGKRETRSQQTRHEIYDAALDLFCETGYKETTLIDIAKAAHVSTRTLHRYFPTKGSILKQFCKENILSLKKYARDLPKEMPLREKVENVMVQDFKYMFCLFDTTYITHLARDDHGIFDRNEIDNIFEAESIYQKLFLEEQLRLGLEPNTNTLVCASTVMGVYRHCADKYRFQHKGDFSERDLRKLFDVHLDIIAPGISHALRSDKAILNDPSLKSSFNATSSLLER
jgi:AcrR family transcriptional regulator